MQLPKYKKKKRLKLKICQEPGCGKEFWGHLIAKYCEYHRDISNRKRPRRKFPSYKGTRHIETCKYYGDSQWVELKCALPGCSQTYRVLLLPKQTAYPDFCPDHRSEHRRRLFLKEKKNEQN